MKKKRSSGGGVAAAGVAAARMPTVPKMELPATRRLFKVPLSEVLEREPGAPEVPNIVRQCVACLELGLDTPMLFSDLGAPKVLAAIREQFEQNPMFALPPDCDAFNEVAGVLKAFLASLPEPLLTWRKYIAIATTAIVPEERMSAHVRDVVESLMPSYRRLLEVVVRLLSRVSRAPDNGISAGALGRLLGPAMLPLRQGPAMTSDAAGISAFLAFLIANHEAIFRDARAAASLRVDPPLPTPVSPRPSKTEKQSRSISRGHSSKHSKSTSTTTTAAAVKKTSSTSIFTVVPPPPQQQRTATTTSAPARSPEEEDSQKAKEQAPPPAPPPSFDAVNPPVRIVKAKALYAFKPRCETELELAIGDVIKVLRTDPSGWWEGQTDRGCGFFPSNYCEAIQVEKARHLSISRDHVSPSIKALQELCFQATAPPTAEAPSQTTEPEPRQQALPEPAPRQQRLEHLTKSKGPARRPISLKHPLRASFIASRTEEEAPAVQDSEQELSSEGIAESLERATASTSDSNIVSATRAAIKKLRDQESELQELRRKLEAAEKKNESQEKDLKEERSARLELTERLRLAEAKVLATKKDKEAELELEQLADELVRQRPRVQAPRSSPRKPFASSAPPVVSAANASSGASVKIVVRVRPGETTDYLTVLDENAVKGTGLPLICDRVFGPQDPNSSVFEFFQPMIATANSGKAVALVACGEKRGGKSYLLFGSPETPGIVQKTLGLLFEEESAATVEIGLLEWSANKLVDMLVPPGQDQPQLTVRRDKAGIIRLGNLTTKLASTLDEATLAVVPAFTCARASERAVDSHVLLLIWVSTRSGEKSGKLAFIDLASIENGSSPDKQASKARHAATSSLAALQEVVHAVRHGDPQPPFTRSKLTQLLGDCFSGDSKTLLVGALGPDAPCDATLEFLRAAL